MKNLITCKLNGVVINCFDDQYTKEQLKEFSLNGELVCPDCNRKYEYCHGRINLPYFRHKEKTDCLDYFSETETEEHINGKTKLYKWLLSISEEVGLKNIKLEHYIKEAKQKPDIYFEKDEKRFVIEYQCTPIATEYLVRHELYQKQGIIDIWVLGCKKYGDIWNGKRKIQENNNHYDSQTDTFYFKNIDLITGFKYYPLKKAKIYNLKDLCFQNDNFSLNKKIIQEYEKELVNVNDDEKEKSKVKNILKNDRVIQKCIDMIIDAFPSVLIKKRLDNVLKFSIPNKHNGKREILITEEGSIIVYRWYIERSWSRQYHKDVYKEVQKELYKTKTHIDNLQETVLKIVKKEIEELKQH